MELRELLAAPLVAVTAGVVLGIALIAPVVWSFRFLAAGKPDLGIAVATGGVFGGMLVALLLMFGYRWLAPAGFVYFGSAVIGGFVLAVGITAVIAARKLLNAGDGTRE